MKLAIVRQKYTPFGGAERFVARALEALRAQGTHVDIIAREWQGTDDSSAVRCNPFYLGRTWRDWGFARCVQDIIASGLYDLVQSHERIPGCHIFRAGDGVHRTWLELSGKPLTALSPWHRYTLAAEQAMLLHPDLRAVICNSRMVRDDIAKRFPAIEEKLHVIYNGIDLEYFHPGLRELHRHAQREKLGVSESAQVILYIGSGYARKGVTTLIEALARMRSKNVAIWIIGRDKDQARYENLSKRLGITSRIRFFGAQPDVRPFLGAADIFCLPTLYDPLPNAALEALACGLPLLTTTTCGAAELVEDGINGSVCPPLDAYTLATRLDTTCQPGVAFAMREAARTSVAALDIAVMADRLLSLYRECRVPQVGRL